MDTNVELQPFMTFEIYDIYIAAILLIVGIIATIMLLKKRPEKIKMASPMVKITPNMQSIYIDKLEKLKNEFVNGKIDARLCSENVSKIMREYIKKAHHKDINHLTLDEMRKNGFQDVVKVIELCYMDEFPRIPYNQSISAITQAQEYIKRGR